MFNNYFIEIRAVYEIMWKDVVERVKPQKTIWRMRIACWIPKATNTHSGFVILIAFPLQKWFARTSLDVMLYALCLCCWYSVLHGLYSLGIGCLYSGQGTQFPVRRVTFNSTTAKLVLNVIIQPYREQQPRAKKMNRRERSLTEAIIYTLQLCTSPTSLFF